MSLSVETFQTLDQVAGAMGSDARFLAGGTLVMRDVNAAFTSDAERNSRRGSAHYH